MSTELKECVVSFIYFADAPPLPSFNVSKVCISASNLTLANIVPMSSICFAKIPSQEYLT